MKTLIKKQTKDQATSSRSTRKTKGPTVSQKTTGASRLGSATNLARLTNAATSTITTVPVLAGFYYAVNADEAHEFTMMQVVEVSTNTDLHTAIKVRQFAPMFKVLPDYLIPEQLGLPVAQFWLPLDEFVSWQPLLMQRGVIVTQILAN
ncbi:hypothetical protein [Psychrobacter pygoscelis]|uniref:hypothetical protein n=1 Tax=Psychrobacter pygoscelis TaxID=2488563 RepID=UPI001039906D|nr:hypothetical protein [Psychrobacter pygoscelis]